MLKFIKNLFGKKINNEPFYHPYPYTERKNLRQDSTTAYAEMPGELDKVIKEKSKQDTKSPLDIDKLRGFGL